jgi:Na+-driven multidrug efflux pump
VSLDFKRELAAVSAFAIPLLVANTVTPLLTMTDTAFVGRCAAGAYHLLTSELNLRTVGTHRSRQSST